MAKLDAKIINIIRAHQNEMKMRFQVASLSIFGSVSRGTEGQDSDVDILVRYEKIPGLFAHLELKKYLEGIIGRRVDLVTESALKKQLRQHILQEAVRVT